MADKKALLKKAATVHWGTPRELYRRLDRTFCFDFDPCPLGAPGGSGTLDFDGLTARWGKRNFVNPPYGPAIPAWLKKGIDEAQLGALSVFLLPARTDTRWFHDLVIPEAAEIGFLRGRLTFVGAPSPAPFPSMIVLFKPDRRAAHPDKEKDPIVVKSLHVPKAAAEETGS